MKQLRLGYSPFDTPTSPHKSTFYPFDAIFDFGVNLMTHPEVSDVDAVVLWGGADIWPGFYGEKHHSISYDLEASDRDLFEWEILRRAYQAKKPIIGVCRGAQMICAFAGGKLIQDVGGHYTNHAIDCYDKSHFVVSSSHHQMMYPYDVQHELLAWTPKHLSNRYAPYDKQYCIELDQRRQKEPEVVYFPEINAIATQCHPEWHDKDDPFNAWFHEQILEKCFK